MSERVLPDYFIPHSRIWEYATRNDLARTTEDWNWFLTVIRAMDQAHLSYLEEKRKKEDRKSKRKNRSRAKGA